MITTPLYICASSLIFAVAVEKKTPNMWESTIHSHLDSIVEKEHTVAEKWLILPGKRADEGQDLEIILYVHDFEIANPRGKSKEIHKISAGYWILANLPVK